jgi:hypothetical protein
LQADFKDVSAVLNCDYALLAKLFRALEMSTRLAPALSLALYFSPLSRSLLLYFSVPFSPSSISNAAFVLFVAVPVDTQGQLLNDIARLIRDPTCEFLQDVTFQLMQVSFMSVS